MSIPDTKPDENGLYWRENKIYFKTRFKDWFLPALLMVFAYGGALYFAILALSLVLR